MGSGRLFGEYFFLSMTQQDNIQILFELNILISSNSIKIRVSMTTIYPIYNKKQSKCIAKKQKKNNHEASKKHQKSTVSTLVSRDSSNHHNRKSNIKKSKLSAKKSKIQTMKDSARQKELFLSLMENNGNLSLYDEDVVSFREYCVIEDKWIPLITSTQRRNIIGFKQSEENTKRSERSPLKELQNSPNHNKIDQIFETLEFRYLADESVFKQMPETVKEHYAQLLQSIISRIKNQTQIYGSKVRSQQSPYFPSQMEEPEIDLIQRRQYIQLGFNPIREENQGIETNLKYILFFIDNLFNLINDSYSDVLIENLRLAYGYEKLNRFMRLRNGQPIETEEEVLPIQIFKHLLEEEEEFYSQFHKNSIFDAINTELIKFKPYYESIGECFPWSLSICPPITFYEINYQTMNVVLSQIKNKIVQMVSTLCGLMVDTNNQNECIRLKIRRIEREDLMFKKMLQKEQYLGKEQIQLEMKSTLVLIEVSSLVYECLVEEIVHELLTNG